MALTSITGEVTAVCFSEGEPPIIVLWLPIVACELCPILCIGVVVEGANLIAATNHVGLIWSGVISNSERIGEVR